MMVFHRLQLIIIGDTYFSKDSAWSGLITTIQNYYVSDLSPGGVDSHPVFSTRSRYDNQETPTNQSQLHIHI